jgi:hypothetical protein
MPSEKRLRKRAVSGRTSAGDYSMKPSRGLRVHSSAGFAFIDPSTTSGRSESIDPDDVGDIADEGLGHRG